MPTKSHILIPTKKSGGEDGVCEQEGMPEANNNLQHNNEHTTIKKKRKLGKPIEPKTKNRKKKKPKQNTESSSFIDISDVPEQPPILKNDFTNVNTIYKDNFRQRPVGPKSSKYTGCYYEKSWGKWKSQIMVDGRVRSIGYYDEEEDAAISYAKAAFKYKPKKGSQQIFGGIDLSNIPEQQELITSNSSSGYKGVKKNKKRWEARISIEKIPKTLGTFDTPEEAAQVYARAVCYLNQHGKGKAGKSKE